MAAREGLEEVGSLPVRVIAIGGGVAPTPSSRVEEMVDEIADGSGDGVGAGAGDSEGGSGVRWAGWIPSSDAGGAACA